MSLYNDEKTQDLQRMILFVEISANVKRFGFYTFVRACKRLNEDEKVLKYPFFVASVLFQNLF